MSQISDLPLTSGGVFPDDYDIAAQDPDNPGNDATERAKASSFYARANHTGTQLPATLAVADNLRILGRRDGGAGSGNELTAGDVRTIISVEFQATGDQTAGEIESIVTHDNLLGVTANEHLDWTADQGATNIDVANVPVVTTGADGLAPATGGGTTNFLRADGTWVAPPVDTSGTPVATDFARFTDANTIEGRSPAEARSDLGVDPAGTQNSTDVTLAGTPNYITLSGQEITRTLINLTTDVTGDLPVAEGGTGGSTAATARTNLGVDAARTSRTATTAATIATSDGNNIVRMTGASPVLTVNTGAFVADIPVEIVHSGTGTLTFTGTGTISVPTGFTAVVMANGVAVLYPTGTGAAILNGALVAS